MSDEKSKASSSSIQDAQPKARAKAKGKIMMADEMLTHRKPVQERSGKEYEQDALDMFNEKAQADYQAAVENAKARGVNPNFVAKPKTYGSADVFSSKLVKDEVNGNRVGIVLNDSKKFYYQL